MLELCLRSGTVVSFDGRVLEVFDGADGSRRYHVSDLSTPRLLEGSFASAALDMSQNSLAARPPFPASRARVDREPGYSLPRLSGRT